MNSVKQDLYLLKKDDQFGYVDKKGNWIIEPKFDHVDFVDDLIYIEKHIGMKVLAGYVTQQGEFLTYDKEQLVSQVGL